MLGNVKAFILVISLAAVFTILLVTGNTMAMSIRERTREVAVLKTLGFRRETILGLFVGEAIAIALVGGIVGSLIAILLLKGASQAPQMGPLFSVAAREWRFIAPVVWLVAGVAGLLSSAIPAYGASRKGIVDGLRHIG
jgi:putative ABC transport system permease protein